MDEITLKRNEYEEVELDQDLSVLFKKFRDTHKSATSVILEKWDKPIDLRVIRPQATDLRKFWALTNYPIPPIIEAQLGPKIPVLLNHLITPFSADGAGPIKVWALGYEFIPEDADLNTISVLPNDEVLKIAELKNEVEVGLQLGGAVGIPESALKILKNVPALSLNGAKLEATTNSVFHLSLHFGISSRKVVGAPVGAGGALWKMYFQDERLDKPHALFQTMVVTPGTKHIKCTIRSWAKQAGWLGNNWGARFWTYEDQKFEISLEGLTT
jgi:hypothetical protein